MRLFSRGLKLRIYKILEIAEGNDKPSRYFDVFIIYLIILNLLAIVLETLPTLAANYGIYFKAFEVFSISVFTVELILRFITCTADEKYRIGRVKGRLKYLFNAFTIIDLIVVVPIYLSFLFGSNIAVIRTLRTFRILRLLKLARHDSSFKAFMTVIQKKQKELEIFFTIVFSIMVVAASLMYYAEKDIQPDKFSSIPAAFWWAIVTITTLGYGDVYPITIVGRLLAGLIALLGLGLLAIPSGILASSLFEVMRDIREGKVRKIVTQNHILVCNWNTQGSEIVRKLLSKDIFEHGISDIVLLADLPEIPPELSEMGKKIIFMRGKPSVQQHLIDAKVNLANTVLILSNIACSDPDADALITTLAVQSVNHKIYICTQVQRLENKVHFKHIKTSEIICMDELYSGISVNSSINHGLSVVVDELLTFNNGNTFYKISDISVFDNLHYKSIAKRLFEKNIILIGYESKPNGLKSSIVVNPEEDVELKIEDALFVIATHKPYLPDIIGS